MKRRKLKIKWDNVGFACCILATIAEMIYLVFDIALDLPW